MKEEDELGLMKMELEIIISLVMSAGALIVSSLLYLDGRKKTKIMEKSAEKGVETRSAIKRIQTVCKELEERYSSERWKFETLFLEIEEEDLGTILHLAVSDISRSIVDKKIKKLIIRPDIKIRSTESISSLSFERLEEIVESKKLPVFDLSFKCEPDIIVNKSAFITGWIYYIKNLNSALENLKEHEYMIEIFDKSVLREIREIYLDCLRGIYGVATKEYEILLRPKIKTDYIYEELANALMSYTRLTNNFNRASTEITQRLQHVARELLTRT